MDKIEHKMVGINGIKMHIAELGEGPLVLFIHSFPELWYSWRHQIVFMAAHGYRVVAPDLRGFGDTTGAPIDDPSKFSTMHAVGDLVALLNVVSPDEDKVFVVGHDLGAIIAWQLCLSRPDKVKALVNLSIPYLPWNPSIKPVDKWRSLYGEDHYMCRFQEPGEIEAEFANIGVKNVLRKFHTFRTPGPIYIPKGKGYIDSPDTSSDALPSWFSNEDLEYYASKFEKTGFTGGVNYYRALNLNWELSAPWLGAKIQVPTKFIVGELDFVYHIPGVKQYIHNGGFQKIVPSLEEIVVVDGAAHFITQERPEEISKHIYDFIRKF